MHNNTSVQPSDQEKGEKGVTVSSLVNERFDKWDEFLPSLKKTYVKRTSTSRDARNRSVQARYSAGGDPTPERELFQDETFPYYLISYECTHTGKHRTRGGGLRPRQHVRSTGCLAKINLLLWREQDSYFLKVSVHHNHQIGKLSFKHL
ncbi:hypothetical protein PI125_g19711 [Phytophthora idaei]|nr:hypothetical protein PI125_g19711 [Phytophthora idaei]